MRLTRQLISIIFADSLRTGDRQLARRDIDRWRLSGSRESKVPTHLFTSSCEARSRRRVMRAIHHPETGDAALQLIFFRRAEIRPRGSPPSPKLNGSGAYTGPDESGLFAKTCVSLDLSLPRIRINASTTARIFRVWNRITCSAVIKAN